MSIYFRILYVIWLKIYGWKQKLETMKSISVCYAIMLFLCVIMGSIVALMWQKSCLWGLLFMFPITWSWVPVAEIRMRIPEFPDFSAVLFVLSFAALIVITTAVTLLMTFESFLSITCIAAAWSALLITVVFIYLIPKGKPSSESQCSR